VGRQAREKRDRRARGEVAPARPAPPPTWTEQAAAWLWNPQPIARLVAIRILVPLAILGFMSSRLIHADDWIGRSGFHVPALPGDDYRQPLYVPDELPPVVALLEQEPVVVVHAPVAIA